MQALKDMMLPGLQPQLQENPNRIPPAPEPVSESLLQTDEQGEVRGEEEGYQRVRNELMTALIAQHDTDARYLKDSQERNRKKRAKVDMIRNPPQQSALEDQTEEGGY